MGDATGTYDHFLSVLQDLIEEVELAETSEEMEGELGGPAAEFGPLADGVVSVLARTYGKHAAEKELMENMKLDELLSYLGERSKDADVIAASRAAARILAMLRWFHYGSFARPDHEEGLDWQEQADVLEAGLDRLLEPLHDGGNPNG